MSKVALQMRGDGIDRFSFLSALTRTPTTPPLAFSLDAGGLVLVEISMIKREGAGGWSFSWEGVEESQDGEYMIADSADGLISGSFNTRTQTGTIQPGWQFTKL